MGCTTETCNAMRSALSKASTSNRTARGRPHKGAQEQRKTYRGLGQRGEHERGAAHVHEEPADPELVERVRLDHLRARTGAGTPRFVRAPAARSGAKAVWRRKGAGGGEYLELEGEGREDVGALLLEDLADVVAGGARQRQRHGLPHLAPAGADPIQRLRAPCVWGEGLGVASLLFY